MVLLLSIYRHLLLRGNLCNLKKVSNDDTIDKRRNNIRLTCFVAAHIKFSQRDGDNNFLAVEDVTVPALLKCLDNLLAKSTLLGSIQEYWQMASDGETVDMINGQLKISSNSSMKCSKCSSK